MEHLLIIEDDKVDQMAFKRFTKRHDFPFTYQLVDSISEAKEALLKSKFDAIVSDFFLGDGTTFEILELNNNMPFIVVTGTGSEEIAVKAIKQGAYDYLMKDVEGNYLKILTITIQNALKHYKAEKENEAYHINLEKLVEKRTIELQKEIEIRIVAEKNLKKLSTAVHQAASSIVITDTHGIIEYVNPKFLEVTEYALNDVVGKNPRILKSGTHPEEFYKTLWKTIKKGEVFSSEMKNKKKDGTLYWEQSSISSIIDDNGEIINYLKVSEDITERKKIVLELEKSEEDLQKAQEIAQIGSFNLNLKTLNAFCSKTFFNITELDYQNSLEFSTWRELVYPADIEKNNEKLQQSIASRGKYDHTFRIITKKTNTLKWVHSIGEVFQDKNKNLLNFKGVIQDITERKKSEIIQKVLYHISNAIVTSNSLVDLSNIIRNELGEIIDTSNFYIALIDEKTKRITLPFFKDEKDNFKSIPSGKTLTDYVISINKSILATTKDLKKLKDENKIILSGTMPKIWLGVPLKINGKTTGILAVQSYSNKDAYSQKDKELLEFVSDQVSIIIHRKKTEDNLLNALEKAKESDRLKTAFLQNMSHEIRTPMNGILGFSDLLKSPNLTDEKLQKYIEIISKSGKRMLNTLNDLMDISKLETGQVKLHKSPIKINEELAHLYDFYKPEVESKGLNFLLEIPKGKKEASVFSDNEKFNAILSNLIKNSIKYSTSGTIKFGYTFKNEILEFFVKDAGIGIPKNRQKAIFDRFVQADIEDKKAMEGAGLGLSICKSYLDMMGGKIWVTSEVEKGSTFFFTLPLQISKNEILINKPSNNNAELKQPIKKLKLLIAEDEDFAYEYLTIILNDSFSEIIRAENGLKAVELCKTNPDLDLILMDLKMPQLSGYEATKEIRKFNKKIPIIAQTAFSFPGDKDKALNAGCNGYLSKPIDRNSLEELIKSMNLK